MEQMKRELVQKYAMRIQELQQMMLAVLLRDQELRAAYARVGQHLTKRAKQRKALQSQAGERKKGQQSRAKNSKA